MLTFLLKLPVLIGLLLVMLMTAGCGQCTVRQVAVDPAREIKVAPSVQQTEVLAEPSHGKPTAEKSATAQQPLLFADEPPEPYQPRGPPGLVVLPFFPAPLILPFDVRMPSEIGIVVDRVMGGQHVVAWAAISPVGWRVGAVRTVGFRYYNPITGRYISKDPLGFPNGLNNYLYVGNNPLNRIDPLGLIWPFDGDFSDAVLTVISPLNGLLDDVAVGQAAAAENGEGAVGQFLSGGAYAAASVIGVNNAVNAATGEAVETQNGEAVGMRELSTTERLIEGGSAIASFVIPGEGKLLATAGKEIAGVVVQEATAMLAKEGSEALASVAGNDSTLGKVINGIADVAQLANARKAKPRNVGVDHNTRKSARDTAQTKRTPQPPKSDPAKRKEWEKQQQKKAPENHPDSKHKKDHYHESDKETQKKRGKPNVHHNYPRR